MALTRSSLSAAMSASDKTLAITSATGLPGVGISARSQIIQVDGEFMETIDGICQKATGIIEVRSRGAYGSAVKAHDILAPTVTSATATDFPVLGQGAGVPVPPGKPRLTSVGQNGVIPVPVEDTTILLTKATALASTTLANPSTGSDGIVVTIMNATAAAHVITFTEIYDGTTGAHTTATFGAFVGASLTLMAVEGKWMQVCATVCPIT